MALGSLACLIQLLIIWVNMSQEPGYYQMMSDCNELALFCFQTAGLLFFCLGSMAVIHKLVQLEKLLMQNADLAKQGIVTEGENGEELQIQMGYYCSF